MSLAFALMAAINSSTGSRATLSHGLYYRTNPRRPQSGGQGDSHSSPVTAQEPSGTLLHKQRPLWPRHNASGPGAECASELCVWSPKYRT